jgi:hypothetical protein
MDSMRTDVNIDAALLAEIETIASRSRRTVGDVIDDALRAMLARDVAERGHSRPVSLPTDGGSGVQPGVDLEDQEALAELLADNDRTR